MASSERLGTDRIGSLLWRLSLPATVGMVVNALYNFFDTLFLGIWVGDNAIGGLTISFPIQMLVMAIGQLIGVGAASAISRYLGAKEIERADQVAGNAYTLMVLFGILFSALGLLFIDPILMLFGATPTLLPFAHEYMSVIFIGSSFFIFAMGSNNMIRAEGNAKTAMITMLIGTGLNLVLDPVFIKVLDMGIRGAAIATVISQFLSFLFILRYFLTGRSSLKVQPHHFRLKLAVVNDIFKIGLPVFIRQVANSLLAIVLNNSLGFYGGDLAINVFGVANRLLMFIFMPLFGVVQGFQPIAGYNYGARNYPRVRESVSLAVKTTVMLSTLGWLMVQFFSEPLFTLFTDTPAMIDLGKTALKTMLFAVPVVGIQIISATLFQSLGKAVPSFVLSLLRQMIILIPLVLLLPRIGNLGVMGIFLAYPISDFLSTAISAVILRHEMKKLKVELA